MGMEKGGWEGRRVGGEGMWVARGMLYLPLGHRQQCCVLRMLQTQTPSR